MVPEAQFDIFFINVFSNFIILIKEFDVDCCHLIAKLSNRKIYIMLAYIITRTRKIFLIDE